MTATELIALSEKIMHAEQGHDTLGPTGMVIHLTMAERNAIVCALADAVIAAIIDGNC